MCASVSQRCVRCDCAASPFPSFPSLDSLPALRNILSPSNGLAVSFMSFMFRRDIPPNNPIDRPLDVDDIPDRRRCRASRWSVPRDGTGGGHELRLISCSTLSSGPPAAVVPPTVVPRGRGRAERGGRGGDTPPAVMPTPPIPKGMPANGSLASSEKRANGSRTPAKEPSENCGRTAAVRPEGEPNAVKG